MIFKTDPYPHQQDIWDRTRAEIGWCLFLEMGVGKTKITLDTVAWLQERGTVDGLLVLAPNGVHRNWVTEEIPRHLPDECRATCHFYESKKAKTKWHQREVAKVTKAKGLGVLAMTYDAIMTEHGRKAAKDFLTKRKVFYALDEATAIKNPGAKRTKRVLASGSYAVYRRVLTGTPVTNSPFDVYTMVKFVDPDFWKRHGFPRFEVFKAFFGILDKKPFGPGGRLIPTVVGYKNLDMLKELLEKISTRVTKEEVLPFLPPKQYSKRFVEMSGEQARAYKEMRENALVQFEGGQEASVQMAIVQMTRLQQITSGFLPTVPVEEMPEWVYDDQLALFVDGPVPDKTSDAEPELQEFKPNARIETLKELCAEIEGKAIIWCRFTYDVDRIMELLGKEAVRHDGQTSAEDRAKAIDRFQNGDARWFVANTATLSTGLTLTAATSVIYYSNSFKLEDRLQSEDRAHRIGQEHPVNYYDLVAPGTIDVKLVRALRDKQNVASVVTGDTIREWI